MIKVVDSIMGSGKSTWARDYINAHPEMRFLYVTPFLKEVEKVLLQCSSQSFFQPKDEISKQADIKRLFKEGANIATTHELFKKLDLTQSDRDMISKHGYTLILDEVLETTEVQKKSKDDAQSILERYVEVNEDGRVRWTAPKYKGAFEDIKDLAERGTLYYFNNSVFIWQFPIQTLCIFKDVYVLTFLFGASHLRSDLDLNGIQYQYYYVQNGELLDGHENLDSEKRRIRKLLEIYDSPKLNAIGQEESDLSKNWWRNENYSKKGKKVKNNVRTLFETIWQVHSDEVMWSCFTDYKKRIAPKGYLKGFCECNARATNDYGDKTCLAYLINVYEHPYIQQWYLEKTIKIDQTKYALSQLLQWIWRSAIRNGKAVRLYLPSARMRRILQNWLDDEEAELAA
ncbi:MAG: hypothetical protein IJ573_09540 [Clostridia bacterium]|nr:hypothetical protein [Clostridia bacterium]